MGGRTVALIYVNHRAAAREIGHVRMTLENKGKQAIGVLCGASVNCLYYVCIPSVEVSHLGMGENGPQDMGTGLGL